MTGLITKFPDRQTIHPGKNSIDRLRLLTTASSPIRPVHLQDKRDHPMAIAATRCVLIVDDDPSIRRLLGTFVRCHGFRLLEARNGREALSAMRGGQADVVVLDLMMPEVSGWDVLDQRELEIPLQRIPVIVVTASDVPGVEVAIRGKHVWSVIGKPFDLEKLLTSITSCLDHPHIDAPVAA